MQARVEATARLHFGFTNLSLSRRRLYGGLGVSIDRPRTVVEASPADDVVVSGGEAARRYAGTAVDLLGVGGAEVSVEREIPRHVGLGSGTQLALAVLTAVGRAHGVEPDPRRHAPSLGRGGRSGVGVATFEGGGFVLDAGHPTELFTENAPERGGWSVPPVAARHDVPEDWRFVVGVPEGEGLHGGEEDRSLREVVAGADAGVADEVGRALLDEVLPGVAAGDAGLFGGGVERVGRLNGVWFAGFQGGVYRRESRGLVEELRGRAMGVGQSSWGPAVYGVTTEEEADEVAGTVGDAGADVYVARPNNTGAVVSCRRR